MLGFNVGRRLQLAVLLKVLDFLEVLRLDEGKELVDSFLKVIVNQTVGEQNRVVGLLYLCDGQLDSFLEFLLGFDPVSNSLS